MSAPQVDPVNGFAFLSDLNSDFQTVWNKITVPIVSTDFDAITSGGTYSGFNAAGTPLANHQTVLIHIEDTRAYQIAITQRTDAVGSRARKWFRFRAGAVWDAWQEVAAVGALPDFSSPVAADWDAIIKSGWYRTPLDAAAIGSPVGFVNMAVEHLEGFDGWAYQRALRTTNGNAGPSKMFFRSRVIGVWSDWQEVATAADVDALVAEIRADMNTAPAVAAVGVAVADASGNILSARNEDTAQAPASLTKVLTALTAVQSLASLGVNMDTLNITVTAPDEVGGSSPNVLTGDVLSFADALKNAFLTSSNNMTMAIARTVGAAIVADESSSDDPLERFVAKMNTVAAGFGASSSNFNNPTGLASGGQVTTARDFAQIMSAALGETRITNVWGLESATITVTGPNARTIDIENAVPMISETEITGGKGGSIPAFNLYNLAVVSRNAAGDDRIAVVINSESLDRREIDARNALNAVGLITDVYDLPDKLNGKISSDPSGVSGADAVTNIISLTQAEYDAIVSPDPATVYLVTS